MEISRIAWRTSKGFACSTLTIHDINERTNSKINRAVWMDIPVADLDRPSGFVDEFLRAVETMRGEKLMGFGEIEVGHGVPVG